ncbi:MAG: carbohydrate-binding domain-containing protein [Oscillospiraceae bacterium]
MKKALSIAVSAAMLFSLSACGSNETIAETPSPTATELQASVETAAVDSSMFTKRDSSTDYDEAAAQYIDLDAQTGDITLTEAGDYVLSGTLTDGSVIINAPEDAKLHLILNGAHIASQSAAALYVISADKVFVTLTDGSENGISAAGDSAEDDYANVDAAIFARCDISFNGSGSLSVSSAKGRGIVSKDDLVFTGGSYMIQAANHGISGKDSIRIADGSFDLSSGNDACHCSGDFDFLAGSMEISAADDGVHSDAALSVSGGSITISLCYDGLEGVTVDISGGMIDITSSDDGINAANGSSDSAHDGTDGTPAESAGGVTDMSGDPPEKPDGDSAPDMSCAGMRRPDGGTPPEKLDGSGDTGTASGSTPEAPADMPEAPTNMPGGMGGGFGGGDDLFAADSSCLVTISGGTVRINAQGDGIDSNDDLVISGGEVYISGPRNGGDGALDYNGSGTISGGIVVACDMGGMSQNFSDGSQCSAMISLNGSGEIRLTDASGNVLLSYTPADDYSCIVVSCPELSEGSEYTLSYGSASGASPRVKRIWAPRRTSPPEVSAAWAATWAADSTNPAGRDRR